MANNNSLLRRRVSAAGAVLAVAAGALTVVTAVAPTVQAAQAVPGHSSLVPQVPRKDTPRISNGEIWDLEVVGNRVFIAGSFTSIADVSGTTTPLAQAGLAAYNIDTGKIDRTFRPKFAGGGVSAVEASPDGSKLYVGGTFSSISGVARQKVASISLTTGTPVAGFVSTASTNNQVTALAATNTTLYVGGKFTRINGALMTGLAALNGTTGAVDTGFNNQISGGVGVSGALTVQQLKLTHDDKKLLVVHTGRKIAGQDRLAAALIDTTTKQLLPWRSRLWDDNLARVGGVTRVYGADIAPDDSYFVVTSGSGGDAPPISDTVVAYPMNPTTGSIDDVQPLWIARCFDSVYSVAITEKAVYIGGHFSWNESPTANQPWPGLDNVGYGTGQGLSGYGLGDQVVRRNHLGALDPVTGTALEWDPWSNSFEGNKAMEATPRGLFTGGDAGTQGGVKTGRVAFFDFNSVPAASTTDTTITAPIAGRVVTSGVGFTITGTAKNPSGIKRVQVEVQDRDTKQFLQDNGTSWGASNNIYATLGTGTTSRTWSLPVTITGNHNLQIMAKTFGTNNVNDATKALKQIESFNFDDQTPSTSVNGPSGIQTSTSFTMVGTATDDHGVNSLTYWFKDENNQYLQDDGSVAPIYNTFRGTPDVIGATAATWSYDVTLPHEGVWTGSATAIDTAGQADLRSSVRDFTINSNAVAPTVTMDQPVVQVPPFTSPTLTVAPGSPITFSGTASDDDRLQNVEITLRNSTTRENLGADGTWGVGVTQGYRRVSPVNINAATYNWSYTTPFNLSPGTYSFTVRATDNDGLTTSSSNQGKLTVVAQIAGDVAPNGTVTPSGTLTVTAPQVALAGTATDDHAVTHVDLTVYDNDTGRYMQADGSMLSTYTTLTTTLANVVPGNATNNTWSKAITLPSTGGDFSVTVYAYDSVGQQDGSPATARYLYFPGDLPPVFVDNLAQPISGATFTDGKIVVTGRAEDDTSIARVEVGIVNSLGQYMSSSGTFSSTTASWRTAFLNSPGSPGSNFSYTTPVIPDGTYSVVTRPTDVHDQIGALRTVTGVIVSHPANNAPVAKATVSCVQNVCTFDGRTSTDENAASLTYSWNFGNGTGSGPVPIRTYTTAGTYTPTLTVKDEWNVTSTVFTLPAITITMPTGNTAPSPMFATNCVALACQATSAGTTDPNVGDSISYLWNWGDLTATSTGATPSHTYATAGTYTITLTATDNWGNATTITKQLVLTEPGTNVPPVAAFTYTCLGLTCTFYNTSTDANNDVMRYLWTFGTNPVSTSTTTAPQKAFTAAGTYAVTLVTTDGWNKSSTVTQQVTVTP